MQATCLEKMSMEYLIINLKSLNVLNNVLRCRQYGTAISFEKSVFGCIIIFQMLMQVH
jgi:hypothetical protein